MKKFEDENQFLIFGMFALCIVFLVVIKFSFNAISADQVFDGEFNGALYTMNGLLLYTDTKGDAHVLQADGTQHDRLRKNVFLSPIDVTYFSNDTGIYVNLSSTDGNTIKVNINKTQKNTRKTFYHKLLNNGTQARPVTNFVYMYNLTNPTIGIKDNESAVEAIEDHVWVTRVLVGNFTGSTHNIYSSADGDDMVERSIHDINDRLYHQGLLYEDGFEPNITATNIVIGEGEYWFIAKDKYSSQNLSLNLDGAFIVNANGDYVNINNVSEVLRYSDTGTLIGNSKYFGVVWGIVSSNGDIRLIGLVMKEPDTEYNSVSIVLEDLENKLVFKPTEKIIRLNFLPIALTVTQRGTEQFEIIAGSTRYVDLRE